MGMLKVSLSSILRAEKCYAVVGSDDFPNEDARFEAQMDVVIQKQEVEANKKKLLGLLQLVLTLLTKFSIHVNSRLVKNLNFELIKIYVNVGKLS